MRDALIGACVRLIEARLGLIGSRGYGSAPRACSVCLLSPWGVLEALWARVTGGPCIGAWRRRRCLRALWTVRPGAGSHLRRSSLGLRHHHE